MNLLIIGSTGTLGRQIVRKALDEGFQVKCLVRNLRKAVFLKEWGAELIYADLSIPETIPLALKEVTAIVDASTARFPSQYSSQQVDLYGKSVLIKAAEIAQVKKFIFFSILNADRFPSVPLMCHKLSIEKLLKQSTLDYTIFYLHGFFQGLISQYAIPILEEKPIWIANENNYISYIDTQDLATFVVRSLSMPSLMRVTLPLVGFKAWTTRDIIQLCEKLSGKKSKTSFIPITMLKFLQSFTSLFYWTWNISERLAFTEVLANNNNIRINMNYVYQLFQLVPYTSNTLENYLKDYFSRILKKLQQLNSFNDEQNTNF